MCACANVVGALQVLITPDLADQVPRQQFAFDFELERSLVAADQRREAGDGAERSDAGTSSLVSTQTIQRCALVAGAGAASQVTAHVVWEGDIVVCWV